MQTHLANALLALLDRRDLSLSDVAQLAALSQPSLSKLIGHGRRPDIDTLRALANLAIPAHEHEGLQLLIAHLRDEVDRAGRPQKDLEIAPRQPIDPADDFALLQQQAIDDRELAAILHDLAELVRAIRRKYPAHQADEPLAADVAAALETPSPRPARRPRK